MDSSQILKFCLINSAHYWAGLLMGDNIGLGLLFMSVCFEFCSTNVVQLSNWNPHFYWFRCNHPLITQLTHQRTLLEGLWLQYTTYLLCWPLFVFGFCMPKKDQSGHQIECLYVNGLPAHSAVEEFSRIIHTVKSRAVDWSTIQF